MSQQVVVGGWGDVDSLSAISQRLEVLRPTVLGVASAYVTVSGIEQFLPPLKARAY